MCTSIHESWIKTFYSGHGSVSLEVEPSVVVIGKSNIDIRCIVDGTNLARIFTIQLNRSNKTVVLITRKGASWIDSAFENKTGVTINASVSNAISSYLHLEISKTAVRYQKDMGSYQCFITAQHSRDGYKKYSSQIVELSGKKN